MEFLQTKVNLLEDIRRLACWDVDEVMNLSSEVIVVLDSGTWFVLLLSCFTADTEPATTNKMNESSEFLSTKWKWANKFVWQQSNNKIAQQ